MMNMMEDFYWFIVLIAFNGLIVLLLALHVSRLRIVKRIAFGDGGDTGMNQAIRAHGNALEHTTIYSLMLLALSLSGNSGPLLASLVLAFTLGRVVHAYGMIGRVFNARRLGAGITYLCELAALLVLFAKLLPF